MPTTTAIAIGAASSTVPIPLPHEVDGALSLFVGFHGTTDGLLGISAYELRAVVSRASETNSTLSAILTQTCEKSSKHARGVIIELSMWDRSCKTVAEEWRWGGQRHCLTRVDDQNGSRWTMPSEDAVVRALWVDFDWPWEASDSWLF